MTQQTLVRRSYEIKDGDISALHFGNVNHPVRLIFLHANGFNAQTYRKILKPLSVHSMALDLRGHGSSNLPTENIELKNWNLLRDDLVDFVQKHVSNKFVLAGHSLGAGIGMLSAPFLKDKLKGYLAFDPVTMPIWMYPFHAIPGWHSLLKNRLSIAVAAGRRRASFSNFDEAFARYKGRGVFKNFPDEVLKDYLEGGLKPSPEGVTLSCDPKWEQTIYAAQGHNLFKAARALPRDNSRIIYAGKGAPHTPTARQAMRSILGKENVERHLTFHHMFPLNNPEFASKALEATLKKVQF